jgi:pimeloyl-ACP methyl ester carboxylesterase
VSDDHRRGRIHFLPGSSGRGEFWDSVRAELGDLPTAAFDWPGLGGNAASTAVNGFEDLAAMVRGDLDGPSVLVAQSMGGVVAARVAAEAPDLVSHLVLAATSAGVDMEALGAHDWRPEFRRADPSAPEWLYEPQPDLTEVLTRLDVPVLLLWADRDAISPLAVGRRLAELLPRSELVVYHSAAHWFARDHASDIAARIRRHIASI